MTFQVGDIVARKSYGGDVHFRIVSIDHTGAIAELKGIDMRLWADAPLHDLVHVDEEVRGRIKEWEEEQMSSSVKELIEHRKTGETLFKLPGRVLHIDGDASYLKKCLELYRALDIPVYGVHMSEAEIPERIYSLLMYVNPDVLVITGHDAYMRSRGGKYDLTAYRHSQYFIQAVQAARQFERNRDNLIIFSGACQSHFEALIEAGANYASSPERVNIHCLDPVYIVEKACYTPIDRIIDLKHVLQYSVTGSSGLGGIDTRGTYRQGLPKIMYET
ncbi:sporulation peptidase YabG [Caldalkalibacillus thermarum TA2.A1]|uniref:Sporulation peptidase YabG n=1 Tax=Caldalkalibacillus thermarum (strain TA2.A1) TaxID=986075 RepID=F5L9Y2_CALTT|nr:sporulation peptidase YabG [Caldalkalibacillus thermarum]EGL81852.1 sporulation peptidase YabG [Caldalkalibacillus thermarum TA2.A1]QZT34340.1 sporulation peptidase YabG [Caldalkalibacillus thermarum TA2.A1]